MLAKFDENVYAQNNLYVASCLRTNVLYMWYLMHVSDHYTFSHLFNTFLGFYMHESDICMTVVYESDTYPEKFREYKGDTYLVDFMCMKVMHIEICVQK